MLLPYSNFYDISCYFLQSWLQRKEKVYLTWTYAMDIAFCLYLLSIITMVIMLKKRWKPRIYNAAIKNVHERCIVEITKDDNITSRCKIFDKHYEIISKILSRSRFGWENKFSIDSDDV